MGACEKTGKIMITTAADSVTCTGTFTVTQWRWGPSRGQQVCYELYTKLGSIFARNRDSECNGLGYVNYASSSGVQSALALVEQAEKL